jgi:hypothetical protein
MRRVWRFCMAAIRYTVAGYSCRPCVFVARKRVIPMTRSRRRGPYNHNQLGFMAPNSFGGHPAPPFTKSQCARKTVCVSSGERIGQFVTVEDMSSQEFTEQVRHWLSATYTGMHREEAYCELCEDIDTWDMLARWYVLLELSARNKRWAKEHKVPPIALFVEAEVKSEVA